MVSRVTTPGNYSAVIFNLLAAQQRQMVAGEKVATQRNGSNLKDFANSNETITAMKTVLGRLTVFQDQNSLIADKLATQDSALVRVADAAQAVRQAMMEAIATGRADNLAEDVEAQLHNAIEGMNARYAGKYLFAGGQVDTRPVTAATLADLTLPPGVIANFFKNDTFRVKAKLDEATTIQTGYLADEIGTTMLTAFQSFQAFQQGPTGPLNGQLTPAQQTFLEGQLASWDQIRLDVTNLAARNGVNQARTKSVGFDLESRHNSLTGMLSDVTDADMAAAASQLQTAQLAVQSAAYVFQALKESSLLSILK